MFEMQVNLGQIKVVEITVAPVGKFDQKSTTLTLQQNGRIQQEMQLIVVYCREISTKNLGLYAKLFCICNKRNC